MTPKNHHDDASPEHSGRRRDSSPSEQKWAGDVETIDETVGLIMSVDVDRKRRNEDEINHARKLLYFSHLFDQFLEWTWQFCLVLFLAAFSNYQSLVLISTYGLCSGLFVCYFGPRLGRFIDGTDRLFAARLFIGLQSLAVLSATTCCYMLLANSVSLDQLSGEDSMNSYGVPTDAKTLVLLVGVHLLGAIAQVLDSGFTVAIERDWIVVMSQYIMFSHDEEPGNLQKQQRWLSETNVVLKQIDLSCRILSPAVAGFVIAGWGGGGENQNESDLKSAALFLGFLCTVALVVEYIW